MPHDVRLRPVEESLIKTTRALGEDPVQGIQRWNYVLRACLIAMVCSAIAVVAETAYIRANWPPPTWSFSPETPFVTSQIGHPREAWRIVMGASFVWSVACIGALKALIVRGPQKTFPTMIIAWQAALLGVILFAPLPFNSDQYAYVGYGELVHMGANPYEPPLKTDPLSHQLRAISSVWGIDEADGTAASQRHVLLRDRYGPVWTAANAIVLAPFEHGSIEMKARVLRIVAALAAIGCSILLWLAVREERIGGALIAAFAFSPAIVMQTALGAHNDIDMLLFGLLTAVLVLRNRYFAAAIALAGTLAVKITFAPLFPAFVALLFARKGARRAIEATGLFIVAIVVLGLPFGLHASLVQPIEDVRTFNQSYLAPVFGGFVRHIFRSHVLSNTTFSTAYTILIVLFALALAAYVARCRRMPWLEVILILMIFCGARFEPWYAIMLTPLLLIPTALSLPIFAGVTLASQIFLGNEIIATYRDPLPFKAFAILAVVSVVAIAVFLNDRIETSKSAKRIPSTASVP